MVKSYAVVRHHGRLADVVGFDGEYDEAQQQSSDYQLRYRDDAQPQYAVVPREETEPVE